MRRALACLLLVLAAACGAPSSPAVSVVAPSTASHPPAPPETQGFNPDTVPSKNPDGYLLRLEGDGWWVGGTQAVPGPYRSMGPREPGGHCSWSVSEPAPSTSAGAGRGGSDGTLGSTVAAGFTDTADDVQRVLVETGETLESGGCQPWIYYGP